MFQFDIVQDRARSTPRSEATIAPNANALWLIFALVALAPTIMALSTWASDNHFTVGLYWIRFLAPPILLIELLAIGLAMRGGFRPIAAIMSLPRPAALVLGLIGAIAFGSAAAIAPDSATAIFRSTITGLHLIFGLSIAHALGENRFSGYLSLWRVIAAGSTVYCLILIALVVAIDDPLHYNWLHFGLGVVNIRHTGFFLVPGAAMSIGFLVTEKRPAAYSASFAVATLCFSVVFWSGSRGPVLSLLAACGIAICLLPQFRTGKFVGALLLSLALGAAISLIHTPPDYNYGLARIFSTGALASADEVSSGRLVLWEASVRASFSEPLFGYGESQFIHVVPEAEEILHHPHNAVMQILVQWGWVSLGLVLWMVASLWKQLLKIAKAPQSQTIPAFLAINAMLVYALYDGVFYFIYPMMILVFLVAASIAAGKLQSERPAP